MLDKTPESPLDCKGIKPVNIKGNQPWILIGRTNADSSSSILVTWCEQPTHWKNPYWERLRAEGQKEKRVSQDWMAGLHHQCNGHELGQTVGDGERQGGLESCSPWGCRVGHDLVTEQQQCVLARDSYFRSVLSFWCKWDPKPPALHPLLILSFSCITIEIWFCLVIVHSYSHLKVVKQFFSVKFH